MGIVKRALYWVLVRVASAAFAALVFIGMLIGAGILTEALAP